MQFSKQKQIVWLIEVLKEKGISFGKGLNNDELTEVKKIFNIEFPEDLEAILKFSLPENDGFIHWRYGINSDKGKREILQRINAPLEGILFDVKFSNFWFRDWGEKPKKYYQQEEIIREKFTNYPKLVPIYSHRYISSKPKIAGNPVFSVYQTDIVYYGIDLIDYLSNEFRFNLPKSFGRIEEPAYIEFWSEIVT